MYEKMPPRVEGQKQGVTEKSNKHKKAWRSRLTLVTLIILSVLLAGLLARHYLQKDTKELAILPCTDSDEIVQKANEALSLDNENTFHDIGSVMNTIQSREGHGEDAKCMHILTIGYIKTTSTDNAEKSLNTLNSILQSTDQEPITDQPNIISLESLPEIVEFLKANKARMENIVQEVAE